MTTQLQPLTLPSQPARTGQGTAIEQSRAVAEVHGAIVVAQQVPRDITRAVAEMRRSCGQKSLAEKAFFRYSRGGSQISGPSVQLARELARCFGNMQFGLVELRRDDIFGQSEMQAWAWDVQTNTRSSTTFIVQHVRDSKAGTTQLTDQRDIYENNANNGARRLREMIFAILPGWFTEDAVQACYNTLSEDDGSEGTLAERIDKAIKGFAQMGVQAGQLEQKLGAPASTWSAYDLATLTVIYRSLQRGEIRKEEEFPAAGRLTVADVVSVPQNGAAEPAAVAPAEIPPPPAEPAAGQPAPPVLSDEHGSVTTDQVNSLWQLATSRYSFTKDDKSHWRQGLEHLIGRKLTGGTVGNLSAREAQRLLDEILPQFATRDDLIVRLAAPPGEAQ